MSGSNLRLLASDGDLKTCFRALSQFVSDAAHVRFDAFEANVTRVDYCHDWHLTSEMVTEYLWACRDISLERMKSHLIDNSTVELRNDAQAIIFYDKFQERCDMRLKNSYSQEEVLEAKGVLRFEVRFRDSRACRRHAKRLGLVSRKAHLLIQGEVADRTITRALARLGLNKPISAGEFKYQLLRDYCGRDRSKCVRLAGFLKMAEVYGHENLVRLGIVSYSDYRRKLAEVKKAGVLYSVGLKHRTLPPLLIHASLSSEGIQAA
jgi:hypothetical protein